MEWIAVMQNSQKFATRMSQIPFSGIRTVLEECTRLENEGRDIVHLEIGRPDFDTPDPIKQAAKDALDAGHVHYTSNYGIEPLREAIATKFEQDNGLTYDSDSEIAVTNGATEAILVSILTLVDDEDEVLIPDPAWTYSPIIRLAGGTPVPYPLDPDDGFVPDMDAVADLLSERTALVVVNSPHNPTGGIVDGDAIDELADLVSETDAYVLSDEIYEKIAYDDLEHESPAAQPGLYDRTVTINGVSKAYSMTGWRLGYLAAPAEILQGIIRTRQYTTTCASSLSQHAAVQAIGSGLHEPMVEAFEQRRNLVVERIANISGMECPAPKGAFYAFPTLPGGYEDDEEFVFSLLREAGVALVPGSVLGSTGEGHVRIAYSNSVPRINEAFDRIEAWL